MATQKNSSNKNAPRKNGGKRVAQREKGSPIRRELGGIISLFLGIFTLISYFPVDAVFINAFSTTLKGLTGIGFWMYAPIFFLSAYILLLHQGKPVFQRLICAQLIPLSFTCLCYGLISDDLRLSWTNVPELWTQGLEMKGCGVVGSWLGALFSTCFSDIGSVLIFLIISLFLGLSAFDRSIMDIIDWYAARPTYQPPPPKEKREKPEKITKPVKEKKIVEVPEEKVVKKPKPQFQKVEKPIRPPKPELRPLDPHLENAPWDGDGSTTVTVTEHKGKKSFDIPFGKEKEKKQSPLQKAYDDAYEEVYDDHHTSYDGENKSKLKKKRSPKEAKLPPTPANVHETYAPVDANIFAKNDSDDSVKVSPSAQSLPDPLTSYPVEKKGEKKHNSIFDPLIEANPFGFFNKKKEVITPDELLQPAPFFEKTSKKKQDVKDEEWDNLEEREKHGDKFFDKEETSDAYKDVPLQPSNNPENHETEPLVTLPTADLEVEAVPLEEKVKPFVRPPTVETIIDTKEIFSDALPHTKIVPPISNSFLDTVSASVGGPILDSLQKNQQEATRQDIETEDISTSTVSNPLSSPFISEPEPIQKSAVPPQTSPMEEVTQVEMVSPEMPPEKELLGEEREVAEITEAVFAQSTLERPESLASESVAQRDKDFLRSEPGESQPRTREPVGQKLMIGDIGEMNTSKDSSNYAPPVTGNFEDYIPKMTQEMVPDTIDEVLSSETESTSQPVVTSYVPTERTPEQPPKPVENAYVLPQQQEEPEKMSYTPPVQEEKPVESPVQAPLSSFDVKVNETPDSVKASGFTLPSYREEDDTPPMAVDTSSPSSEGREYKYPPLSLLKVGGNTDTSAQQSELEANRTRLEETLRSFNINATMREVTQGPSVTRYEVELEQGIKLSKLTNLSDDIALALGATGVRIAPIPDKISMVGIEVPNKTVTAVEISQVIGSANFFESDSKVSFAVGKDITGEAMVGNIAKMPHLLVAGTTGSGKSVCTNSLIISLLYKSSPEEVRLIMVDPKMVELSIYNGIPHLLIPVVTDPKKAAGALQWAVFEMMKRYKLFSEVGTRDLASYNKIAEETEGMEKMPQIVVIIDELADLMLVAAKEVEESICRVAQMGRASGMHLIIATQRPSADVITGLMKANIPSRIAFAVSSSMESRIILDTQGAEKLVGRGDMLYAPLGEGKPTRVQGCFISDPEVAAVVNYVKKESGTATYSEEIMEQIDQNVAAKEKNTSKSSNQHPPDLSSEDQDEMLYPAIDLILETKQASVSNLQRKLKLGYARAARIVDSIEEMGIVGAGEGGKPRQILISKEQWAEIKYKRGNPSGGAPSESNNDTSDHSAPWHSSSSEDIL